MTYKKFSSGEPVRSLPSREWNAFVDALGGGGTAFAPNTAEDNGTIIQVKNNTGYAQPRFSVLGIDAPIIVPAKNVDEFQNRIMFGCSLPNPSHVGRFVVTRDALPSGGIGDACLAGVTVARVMVTSKTATAIVAGPRLKTPGYLEAGIAGARILWREPGIGLKWAVVRLFEAGGAFGRLFYNQSSEIMPACGVGRVVNYTPDSEGEYSFDIDKPSTAFDRLYVINSPAPVPAGKFGLGYFLEECYVAFSGSSPAVGESWGAKPDDWKLAKNRYGFTVLGGIDLSLGVFRAQQHVVNHVIGKTYAAINKGASGLVDVYAGTLGSETATTQQLTSWNRFANVAITKWVGCRWIGGGWDLTAAEC